MRRQENLNCSSSFIGRVYFGIENNNAFLQLVNTIATALEEPVWEQLNNIKSRQLIKRLYF